MAFPGPSTTCVSTRCHLCCALKSKQVDDSMVSEAIADLQLIPQVKRARRGRGRRCKLSSSVNRKQQNAVQTTAEVLVPAAAALLVMVRVGHTRLHRTPDPSVCSDGRRPLLESEGSAGISPCASCGRHDETMAAESAPNTAPIEITVEPDQTLQDISVQYLGGYDLQRLHQIQALNPKLTDPDHIEAGQKIWLPGPPPVPVATNATPPASARKLP